MTKLSLRRLWTLYKAVAKAHGTSSKWELVLLQDAFYGGARGVLKVLAYMIEQGEQDEMLRAIERHGRQINRIQGLRPRARRH
jgi:hypothetical protein